MRTWLGVAAMAAAIITSPARAAEWTRVESPHFIVYGPQKPKEVREAAERLERFDELLRTLMNIKERPSPNKLRVFLMRGPSDLRRVRPGLSKEVAGFYGADVDRVSVYQMPTAAGMMLKFEVLQHEYAHHFMLQHLPNAYPRWFIEGFAEYFQTVSIDGQEIEIGDFSAARAYTLTTTGWTPMRRLMTWDFESPSSDKTFDLYAQGWLATHWFLSDRKRTDALNTYLAEARKQEAEPEVLFKQHVGLDFSELDYTLQRYMRGRIPGLRLTLKNPPPVLQVTTSAADGDDMILWEERIRAHELGAKDDAALNAARSSLSKAPEDPSRLRIAAWAEVKLGDPAVAIAYCDRRIAANDLDAEAYYLKGLAMLRQSQTAPDQAEALVASARRMFAKTHAIDENHVGALFYYAVAQTRADAPASDATLNIFRLAAQLAPQVDAVTMTTAYELLKAGAYPEAEAMLLREASDPHLGNMRSVARRLLQDAQARRPPSLNPTGAGEEEAAAAP